jgi:hypothetical protein
MVIVKFLLLLCLLFPSQQKSPPDKSGSDAPPPLPIIDSNACPFEGCMFRKWVIVHDSDIFSSWREDRKFLSKIKKGDVVAGLYSHVQANKTGQESPAPVGFPSHPLPVREQHSFGASRCVVRSREWHSSTAHWRQTAHLFLPALLRQHNSRFSLRREQRSFQTPSEFLGDSIVFQKHR